MLLLTSKLCTCSFPPLHPPSLLPHKHARAPPRRRYIFSTDDHSDTSIHWHFHWKSVNHIIFYTLHTIYYSAMNLMAMEIKLILFCAHYGKGAGRINSACERSVIFFSVWNNLNENISFWNTCMLFWELDIFNLNNIFSSPLIT